MKIEVLKCLGPFSKPSPVRRGTILLGQAIQNINQPTAISVQLRISPEDDDESSDLTPTEYSQGSLHVIGHLMTGYVKESSLAFQILTSSSSNRICLYWGKYSSIGDRQSQRRHFETLFIMFRSRN